MILGTLLDNSRTPSQETQRISRAAFLPPLFWSLTSSPHTANEPTDREEGTRTPSALFFAPPAFLLSAVLVAPIDGEERWPMTFLFYVLRLL